MTLASLLLVVLASFIHATWNLLAKRAAAAGPVFVFAYNAVACVAYAPWVFYVLAQGRIGWSWTAAGFILPTFALTYGFIFAVIFFFRIDYSRFQAGGSFMLSTLWYFAWSIAARRVVRHRLAIVPGGNVSGIERIRRWRVVEPFTVENGLMTPTMKVKRNVVSQKYADDIAEIYA